MEGEIWPTQKFWRSAPYARPLAGFMGGIGRKGEPGTEREKRGRKEEKWKESWNRAAEWLRPALCMQMQTFTPVMCKWKILKVTNFTSFSVTNSRSVFLSIFIKRGFPKVPISFCESFDDKQFLVVNLVTKFF